MAYQPTIQVLPISDANRLGLDYRAEASRLPWAGGLIDGHIHISGVAATRTLMDVARRYGIERFLSQTPLEEVDTLRAEFGDRFEFIAIPNYWAKNRDEAFTTDWYRRLEGFRDRGVRIAKFWGAPRGRDLHDTIRLDHPTRLAAIKHAVGMGMSIMVHVADPDTWFATHYRDARRYGTKREQYLPLRHILEAYPDTPLLAAHLAGDPEHLDHLQELLDLYPHLFMDISATKWMVRELGVKPAEFGAFCRRNPGRLLWGTDNVISESNNSFELYASRYWCMRSLIETDYHGPSPIVDPDLSLVNPAMPKDSAPLFQGAGLDPATLWFLYRGAADRFCRQVHGLAAGK